MSLQVDQISNSILEKISLSVDSGKTLIIRGPSGAGKTTLLRTIAGLEPLKQGSIFLKEKNITNLPAYKREIAMVFQSHALFPYWNVKKNIAFPLQKKGIQPNEISSRIEYFLEVLQISTLAKRYPSSLSGGEKQRVALAQILSMEPKALFLDEPLSHLDIPNQKILQKEIKKFQIKYQIPILYVTHDPYEAKEMGDASIYLNKGRLCSI